MQLSLLNKSCADKKNTMDPVDHAKWYLKLLHIFVLIHAKVYLEIRKMASKDYELEQGKLIASISMMNGPVWEIVNKW